jgi:transcriptional regulator with XRE-family HTH domain
MGQRSRSKPQFLGAKLLAIRQRLGVSQSEMVRLLNAHFTTARISEYESGIREPNLLTILAYSRAARIPVEKIIDDDLSI